MSAIWQAPLWSILLANRYKSLSCEWFSIAFFNASNKSPFKLQLLSAKDFKLALFDSD